MYQQKKTSALNRENLFKRIDSFFLLNREGKYPELDGLRGWAVLMVFMLHFAPVAANYYGPETNWSTFLKAIHWIFQYTPFVGIQAGNLGVDLFFMLSGFLIFLTIHKNTPSIKSFMINRYKRLLPAHFFVILQSLTVTAPIGMFVNIFFLTYFFPKIPSINFVTWTLSYEFFFYTICALWFILGSKNKFLKSWSFFFLFFLFFIATAGPIGNLLSRVGILYVNPDRFMAFFFGLGLAKLFRGEKKKWERSQKVFTYGAVPSIIVICLLRLFWDSPVFGSFLLSKETVEYVIFDTSAFVLFGSLLLPGKSLLKTVFGLKPLRILGVVSYSFYLNHAIWGIPIAARIMDSFQKGGGFIILLLYPLSLFTTFVIASFMFYYLEKPYFAKKW